MPLVELCLGLAHDGDIRVTQPATAHLNEKLAGAWGGLDHILKLRRLLRLEQTIGNHALISSTVSEVPFSSHSQHSSVRHRLK
jgi:hypothetical protein